VALRNIHWVDADGGDADTVRGEVGKALLETPQLGVAEQSPVAAIKDEERALWFCASAGDWLGKKVGEADGPSVLISEREIRGFLADVRRRLRARKLPAKVKQAKGEHPEYREAENTEDGSKNLPAIDLRLMKRTNEAYDEQYRTAGEQEKAWPRKISRNGVPYKEQDVARGRSKHQQEASPEQPVPSAFHRRLVSSKGDWVQVWISEGTNAGAG